MASSISVLEYEKALETLEEALAFSETVKTNESQFKIARDACIQRFEYCIELSWKISMKQLGSQTKFPKPAVREMGRGNLVASVEDWLSFVEARNETSHSYNEDTAKKVFASIQAFAPAARDLLSRLKVMP